jgi:hypothetical protein
LKFGGATAFESAQFRNQVLRPPRRCLDLGVKHVGGVDRILDLDPVRRKQARPSVGLELSRGALGCQYQQRMILPLQLWMW